MDCVLTLVATPPLPPVSLDLVTEAVRPALVALGARVGAPEWLAPGVAVDLPLRDLDPDQAQAAARHVLGSALVDVIAQPLAGRKKRLLVADMDATMIAEETLDEIAAEAGCRDQVAPITTRAMRGELDFVAALTARVALLAGQPVRLLDQVAARLRYTPGGAALVAEMAGSGAPCLLVSGGFTVFTALVARHLGFHEHHSNVLEIAGGVLTGRVLEPIRDGAAKLATLRERAAAHRVPLEACLAVGDGANDIPMLQAAGLGVAFHAKPAVAAAARARIDHSDLTALLYLQGWHAHGGWTASDA